jgi:hypothetical protein
MGPVLRLIVAVILFVVILVALAEALRHGH